jgi:hypothetical protein
MPSLLGKARIIDDTSFENATATGQLFGSAWILARELEFEIVRLRQFPQLPSRFEAAFCCPNEGHARVYQAKVDFSRIQVLHRVEFVDPALPAHVGPIEMLDWPAPNTSFLDETQARTTAYWTGIPDVIQEVVTLSALRVIANID